METRKIWKPERERKRYCVNVPDILIESLTEIPSVCSISIINHIYFLTNIFARFQASHRSLVQSSVLTSALYIRENIHI